VAPRRVASGANSSGPEAYDGQESAALRTVLTVAEEKVLAAGSAEIAHEDIREAKAGAEELGAIAFPKVKEDVFRRGLVAGGHHVQPLDGIGLITGAEFVKPLGGFGELGEELSGDFGADFVAAPSDGGADGGEEVGRLGFELHLHPADGFDDNARKSAAPTSVNGGYDALFRIYQEDGDAVGGLDSEKESGTIGD